MASIGTIKQLEPGTKGLATEGTVVYCNPRKHLQGTSQKTGKDYDFYSQFIIVEDDNNDSIVVDLGDSLEVQKGQFVKLYKGLLKSHVDNKGNNTVKLSAQLVQDRPQSAPQTPSQPAQATNVPAGGVGQVLALCDQLRAAIASLGQQPRPGQPLPDNLPPYQPDNDFPDEYCHQPDDEEPPF